MTSIVTRMCYPLCRPDTLLGLELDDVLLGDAGIASGIVGPTATRGRPLARAADAGWGAWRERVATEYAKREEKRLRRWRKREAKRVKADRAIQVGPIAVYVAESVPRWWIMWSLLWLDLGWCARTLGSRTASNRAQLIKDGSVTIYLTPDERLPICRVCNRTVSFLVLTGPSAWNLRPECIPCWLRGPMSHC